MLHADRAPASDIVISDRVPPWRPAACAAWANPYVTFGLSATRLKKLRPFSGRSVMRFCSITVPTVAFSVVSSGAAPVTSTVSRHLADFEREIDARGLLHLQFDAGPARRP